MGIVEGSAHVGRPASGAETAESESGAESAISVDAESGAEAASVVGSPAFAGPPHAPHATIGGTRRA
jgi:hypothetical protein